MLSFWQLWASAKVATREWLALGRQFYVCLLGRGEFITGSLKLCVFCRSPEWGRLVQHGAESDQAYKERMRDLGLCFRSKVAKPGELVRQVLQAMLHISQAEAEAILVASGMAPDAVHGAEELPDQAAGTHALADEDAGESLSSDLEGDSDSEDELHEDAGASVDGCRPALPPHAPLLGLKRAVLWEKGIRALGGRNLRVRWAVECPRDDAVATLRTYAEMRRFFKAHASCMCAPTLLLFLDPKYFHWQLQ